MPVPDRGNPNQPRIHVDDLGGQRAIEGSSRGGWRWWWVFPVIIALAVWWAGWGWGGTGGWWWGRPAHTAAINPPPKSQTTETVANAGAQQPAPHATNPRKQPMSGPGVQILKAPDKQAYIGKQFAASDVPVRQKVNDHTLWIGEEKPMLAVVKGDEHGAAGALQAGKIIDAQGTVQKAPSKAKAEREWNLSDDDASRLEKQGAYIEVSELYLPPQ